MEGKSRSYDVLIRTAWLECGCTSVTLKYAESVMVSVHSLNAKEAPIMQISLSLHLSSARTIYLRNSWAKFQTWKDVLTILAYFSFFSGDFPDSKCQNFHRRCQPRKYRRLGWYGHMKQRWSHVTRRGDTTRARQGWDGWIRGIRVCTKWML